MQGFYELLSAALSDEQPFTLAPDFRRQGFQPAAASVPKRFSFRMDGSWGTLGGGCLEAEVHARALRALQTGESATFEMVLDHDFGWDDGLICGGSVTGLILPRARQAGALWPTLVNVTAPVSWGVKQDFSTRRR